MKTVLLVDDEQCVRESLGEILHRLGYEVITRPDANAALAVLREGAAIDLVITDYRMPEINGLEFILLVKTMLPSLPIIVLTGYGEVESYLKAVSLGVFEYMNKPVRLKELDRIVRAALESSALREKPGTVTILPLRRETDPRTICPGHLRDGSALNSDLLNRAGLTRIRRSGA